MTKSGAYEIQRVEFARGSLLYPTFNITDSASRAKIDASSSARHQLPAVLKAFTSNMIAGKLVWIAGYGSIGKGCAAAMKAEGAQIVISEIDSICALQAVMQGYQVTQLIT